MKTPTRPELDVPRLLDEVLMLFPAGHYGIPALLRVLSIELSTEVPSACVQCQERPRMLINPKFVRQHAYTAPRLLMLMMHELHHVILGHTRLYPRPTPAHNIVFDAVINATLCSMFPDASMTSLLTSVYRTEDFPECLLRPPEGWQPGGGKIELPEGLRPVRRRHIAKLYTQLYTGGEVTYGQLLEALQSSSRPDSGKESPKGTAPEPFGEIVGRLLGDHESEGQSSSAGGLEHRAPALLGEVRRIVERWPQPPNPIVGRSQSEMLRTSHLYVPPPPPNHVQLIQLIRKIADPRGSGARQGLQGRPTTVMTCIPRPDRRSVVMSGLGTRPFFYTDEVHWPGRGESGLVHLYVDVSGSMDNLINALYAAVLACREAVHPAVHLFSTQVRDVSFAELRRGVCHTTGGTDVRCIAGHMREHRVGRAVIVTDGYVGDPGAADAQTLQGAILGVAFSPGNVCKAPLDRFAQHFIFLN